MFTQPDSCSVLDCLKYYIKDNSSRDEKKSDSIFQQIPALEFSLKQTVWGMLFDEKY